MFYFVMQTLVKHRVICISYKFPTQPTLLKKWLVEIKLSNFRPPKAQTCSYHHPEKMAAFGYPSAKISVKVGNAPTVSPVVDRATHRQAPTAKEPLQKN